MKKAKYGRKKSKLSHNVPGSAGFITRKGASAVTMTGGSVRNGTPFTPEILDFEQLKEDYKKHPRKHRRMTKAQWLAGELRTELYRDIMEVLYKEHLSEKAYNREIQLIKQKEAEESVAKKGSKSGTRSPYRHMPTHAKTKLEWEKGKEKVMSALDQIPFEEQHVAEAKQHLAGMMVSMRKHLFDPTSQRNGCFGFGNITDLLADQVERFFRSIRIWEAHQRKAKGMSPNQDMVLGSDLEPHPDPQEYLHELNNQ